MQGSIHCERKGRVGSITIDRPPLNILNIEAFDSLHDALSELTSGGSAVDVIVIRSAGEKAFCAGADIGDHTPEAAPRMLESFHRVARRLRTIDAVTVAAARGVALGGGFELLQCCDIVVAAEDIQLGQPEILVGSFPPIAAVVLPAAAGGPIASDLVLTGRRVTGQEALARGLVSRLVPASELDAEVGRVVESLERNSGAVMRLAVKALRGSRGGEFVAALARTERIYIDELLKLEDAREGVKAFMEKRPPKWSRGGGSAR
jgi:cyclohexa-1,5-dienecarbonyl-CoA hydratase